MCYTRLVSMAFKQVRPRWSIFRPWAFGESGNSLNNPPASGGSSKLDSLNDSAESFKSNAENAILGFSQTAPSILRTEPGIALVDNLFVPGPVALPPTLPPMPFPTPESLFSVQEPLAAISIKDPSQSEFPWVPADLGYPVSLNHLLPQTSQPKFRVKKQRPKKFQCPHCRVSFSNNGQLLGHIRIHTGERPFRCDHPSCSKTFTRNEELTRHKKIHTGHRPHACPRCGKRFGRKDHLHKHFRTHLKSSAHPFHPQNPGIATFLRDWIGWF